MKKILTLAVLVIASFSGAFAQCDTLFNLTSSLDTPNVILIDTPAMVYDTTGAITDTVASVVDTTGFTIDTSYVQTSAGYLSGNNYYGDLAKAEAFGIPDTGYYLIASTLYFGAVTINPTDTYNTVTITVWDNMGVSIAGTGAPGNVIDTFQVTLGQIAMAVSANKGLRVFFSNTAEIPTDTIYIGVVLPSVPGDAVALLTNTASGPDGNGWELEANPLGVGPQWNSYNNAWGITGGSLGNYIRAHICTTPPTGYPAATFLGINQNAPSTCSPDAYNFTDFTTSTPAPSSWTWSFGDGNYSNLQDPSDVYLAGGTYIVTESVTNDTGNAIQVLIAAYDTINVLSSPSATVIVTPPASDTSLTTGTVTLSGGTGNDFYTWSDGTTGSTDTSLVAGGVYAVTVQDQNGCTTVDSFSVPYPLGILALSGSGQVKVYPNPATDVLTLEWSQKSNAEISVIDLNGNEVSRIETAGEMRTICDIHNLATGVYVLRITDLSNNKQQSMLFTKL